MSKHLNLNKISDCVQCYKCVRRCPVKAIRVSDTNVDEDYNLCINCGRCYNSCNKGIHFNEFDLDELDNVLKNEEVIAVLDSTLFMALNDVSYSQIKQALIDAGFNDVKHSFDGLVVHDYIIKKYSEDNDGKFFFNTNCMPFVDYVKKYKPETTKYVLPYLNASAIACKLIEERYPNKKILLITNCFGDVTLTKNESGIDYFLLGEELISFLKYKNIDITSYKTDTKKELMYKMVEVEGVSPNTVAGFESCENIVDYALTKSHNLSNTMKFFICDGGCFNSNAIRDNLKPIDRERRFYKFLEDNFDIKECESVEETFGDISRFRQEQKENPLHIKEYSKESIESILKSMDIDEDSGEYNCNACGYKTCENFARNILNDRAYRNQCVPYLMRENKKQKAELLEKINELNEAFSLTIPDSKLEKKLKTTPIYKGVYDVNADYFEVTEVVEKGLYFHIINCLKLAADLQDCNVFSLIGIDKNTLVYSILYHANAKTQPILCVGDVVKYSALFEDKKSEASRSATFAKNFYNVSDDVCNIIRYQNHTEIEILNENFPKYLLPTYRLFKMIDSISATMTRTETNFKVQFKFVDFILYIHKKSDTGEDDILIDLYRELDMDKLNNFLK